MRSLRWLSFGIALVAAVALSACAGTQRNAPPASAPDSAGANSVVAPVLSGIVATGTLVSAGDAAGSIAGTVTVTADPASENFAVTLTGFTLPDQRELSAHMATTAVQPGDTCEPDGMTFSFGDLASFDSPEFLLPGRGALAENPSFYTDFTLERAVFPAPDGCGQQLVAYAPLQWNIPDVRPSLRVTDSGSRQYATGQVATSAGDVTAYTVVRGDTISAITGRFGITIDDVFYLNPARLPSPEDLTVYVGEVLNLSKAHR